MSRGKVCVLSALIAHIWAWAVSLFFIFLPVIGIGETGIEINGVWDALLLVVPIALSSLGLIVSLLTGAPLRFARILFWTPSVAMTLFCIAVIFSIGIGIYYAPAALAMWVSAAAGSKR